jgi:hypothetical protein
VAFQATIWGDGSPSGGVAHRLGNQPKLLDYYINGGDTSKEALRSYFKLGDIADIAELRRMVNDFYDTEPIAYDSSQGTEAMDYVIDLQQQLKKSGAIYLPWLFEED